jgi:hypothetical protein
MQFATYYSQATGTSLSPIPMASIPTLARYLGDAGFTYSQTVWGTLIGPIGDLLNALYPIWTWAKNFIATNQQINLNTSAAAQMNASSVSALTTQYLGLQNQISSAQASGNTALASTLTAQANSVLSAITKLGGTTPTPTPTTLPSFSAWFETNWPWLALALGAVVIVPPLLKKI